MLQKQIPREGFHHIWPFLGLSKNEVLKRTCSNIHRSDSNVARTLGQTQPAASWKMRKGEKTKKIKCTRLLLPSPARHGTPFHTRKEELWITWRGYLLVWRTELAKLQSAVWAVPGLDGILISICYLAYSVCPSVAIVRLMFLHHRGCLRSTHAQSITGSPRPAPPRLGLFCSRVH